MKKTLFLLPAFIAQIACTQSFPPNTPDRVLITPAQVFDITQGGKKPENLFDGDSMTAAIPDFYNGYILDETKGQVAWVVLDSFVNHPRIIIYNGPYAHGGQVDFQFYYDWTDTSRHSPVYSTTLPASAWKWVDTANSLKWSDSARLLRIRIAHGGSNHFTEVRLYANRLAPAPPIYPEPAPAPPDEGKYFMGYGKVFADTMMDDAGYSQRSQGDMGYIDTARVSDGKTMVLSKYGNSVEVAYLPAVRNGRKILPYFAGPRDAFKYPPHYTNDSKDIPRGADSTSEEAWQAVYNTYYGLAAKLGHNKKASLEGYTFYNTPPGAGLGLIEEMEVGNEDDARWAGPLRFHNPLVKLMKLKQGYAGIKAADPNMKVVSGALAGIDTSYLKAMYLVNLLRFKTKAVPFDAIAVNAYATTTGGQHNGQSDGITPEQFQLYEKLRELIDVRNRYYPGKPIYLTEYGYDVHAHSNYNVPNIPGQTPEQTKASWVLRSMEISAASRINRYYQYTQRNIPGGDFSTTGFSYDTLLNHPGRELPEWLHPIMNGQVLANGGWTSLPKDLYWHMTMRAKVLEHYNAWPTIVRKGDDTGIWILKYTHRNNADSAVYAVWMGTCKNKATKNYTLPLEEFKSASIVRAAIGKKRGDEQPARRSGKGILLPIVDEHLTYVRVRLR